MFNVFNSLSFELYIFVAVLVIIGSIYAVFEIKKKQSENPTVWIFPFLIVVVISLAVSRCSIELTNNLFFQKFADILVIISSILFAGAFLVSFILAYKKNYINKDKFKRLVPIIIIGCIMVFVGFLGLELIN